MAKKNFKGGLDSLIENSLGMKKNTRRGELKGNPIDLIKNDQVDDYAQTLTQQSKQAANSPAPQADNSANNNQQQPIIEVNPQQNVQQNIQQVVQQPQQVVQPQIVQQIVQQPIQQTQPIQQAQLTAQPTTVYISETPQEEPENVAHLKAVMADLRHELYLWRNGKINVQIFNSTLNTHGLKYNPENNEIEEIE